MTILDQQMIFCDKKKYFYVLKYQIAISLFSGPLSSVLSIKYSYKTVTLIGGTFAALGMMTSYFATSVSYLYVR